MASVAPPKPPRRQSPFEKFLKAIQKGFTGAETRQGPTLEGRVSRQLMTLPCKPVPSKWVNGDYNLSALLSGKLDPCPLTDRQLEMLGKKGHAFIAAAEQQKVCRCASSAYGWSGGRLRPR